MSLPLREFVSPLPLIALVVLALNDHLLKWTFHNAWTGKLSDVAGLIYFPLLLTAWFNTTRTLLRWAARRVWRTEGPWPVVPLRRLHLGVAITLTGGVFTAIKLSPWAMDGYLYALSLFHRAGLIGRSGAVVDPTDLVALPALGVAWWWGRRYAVDG